MCIESPALCGVVFSRCGETTSKNLQSTSKRTCVFKPNILPITKGGEKGRRFAGSKEVGDISDQYMVKALALLSSTSEAIFRGHPNGPPTRWG